MKPFKYETSCVHSSGRAVQDMCDKSSVITCQTFSRHCDYKEASQMLGYGDCPGLTLANDYHVGFRKSTYRGRPCYYIIHSAIEYIFTRPWGRLH